MKPALIISGIFLLNMLAIRSVAADAIIIDSEHYSSVFGELRHYRIFLPPSYFDTPQKRYPVIYFYHGWSQRYFGSSDHYADFDQGVDNNGDHIAAFVSGHDVIVVKPDGYNRSPGEPYYVRPYNIGPVETYRQFPLYFPELVEHIDDHYNTMADREHRAISGLSMGGFMTFWIAGKYPHLLTAAGNFCGSPEFVVGPKDYPAEYRHLDMYKNYAGLKLRLHYGDKDFIRGYHEDLNRVWDPVTDNYEWKIYDAAHSTCGLGDMFDFVMETFDHPPPRPQQWDHIDVYPNFSVWDYQVRSDRNIPGFTIMENVDKRGFKCSVREFLPDGALLPFVNVSITTPAVYEKNSPHIISDMDTKSMKSIQRTVQSDDHGRLTIEINGSSHEIGINKTGDLPSIRIASVEIQNTNWISHHKDVELSIKLLNKGLYVGNKIQAQLSAIKNNVLIKQDQSEFGPIAAQEIKGGERSFIFQVTADSIEMVKFKLSIWDENQNEWFEFFELPVKKDVPVITDFVIADGKVFTVAKGGNDLETVLLGSGNGDGVANPGESIVVLIKDQDKYWRTDLFSANAYINPYGINRRISDYWGSYDHVGGSAKYHIPLISSDCPENQVIDFFAEYWLPAYPLHIIKQGTIRIAVKGKDTTPPQIRWVQVSGNNTVQVKIEDGSIIQSVTAKIISKGDPSISFEVDLQDEGKEGDRIAADNVFSKTIADQKFGMYRIILKATDSFGNTINQEAEGNFILY